MSRDSETLEMASLGEFEGAHEWEGAHEGAHEGEYEDEAFLGNILRGVGGALGLGESEWESTHEFEGAHEGAHEWEAAHEGAHEWELAHEYEGEEFFRRLKRGIGSIVRRAAPLLKNVARMAVPMVAGAVGGPLGGILGKVATSALGEGEFEGAHEWEASHESEWEASHEGEWEAEAAAPMSQHEAMAEFMAAVASGAQTEAEAEAMIGAATMTMLSPADHAALRRVEASLVRGAAVLT